MIAQEFTDRARAIPYPDSTDRDERVRLRREYDAAHAELNGEFAAALADEYLSEISETRRAAIGERTFALAWEHGHSSGYSEIENYYMDFAGFAIAVYSAATS